MAKYRDDRDALRDRADALERELSAARNEIAAKDAALAHRAAEVERLRRKAGERAPGDVGTGARAAAIVAGVAVALVVAGGVVGFMSFSSARAVEGVPPEPAPPPPPVAVVTAPPPSALPRPDPMPRERIEHHVSFGARVTSVTGRADVRVGAPCIVVVDASNVAGVQSFEEVVVRCGAVELHRMTQTGGTIVSMSTHVLAPAVDDPEGRFTLRYEDVGTRSIGARSQAAIDSEKKGGRVFTEGAAPTEVVLAVDPLGKPSRPAPPPPRGGEVVF